MTLDFYYTLDENGYPSKYGMSPSFGIKADGTEPFKGFDIVSYRKDLTTGEWIYDPIIMVPQEISKLQAVLRLLEIDRYNDLMLALDSDPTGVKRILFDAAHVLYRDSTMVNEMGTALGFTSEELDTFFVEADMIMV